jgi:formate dehydrogenase subunit gamma
MTAQQDARDGALPSDGSALARARRAVSRDRLPGGRGLLLPALHAVQDEFGHVPDEAVAVLAEEFNVSRADVHGVLTFYPDFRRQPGGRVTIAVCRAEACQAVGAGALLDEVAGRLGVPVGAVTPGGGVALEEVFCLGNCALGPSASVAGRVLGRATADRILAAAERAAG